SIQRVGAEIDREHGTLVRDGHVGVRTLLAVRILALSTVLADMQRAERSAAVELDRGDRPAAVVRHHQVPAVWVYRRMARIRAATRAWTGQRPQVAAGLKSEGADLPLVQLMDRVQDRQRWVQHHKGRRWRR